MKKRVLSFLLVLAMLCTMLPQVSLPAMAQIENPEETTEPTIEETEPAESVPEETEPVVTISRAQWVTYLVETFVMYIEGDNYPDNYYSDISADDPYYRDIMIAVEFGVVDIPAGQPFYPEEPATRAFATHTLNFCLGFLLGEEVQYTYSDVADVEDAPAAQIALDRNWVSLIDGKFMPEQLITEAECAAMLADAQAVVEEDAREPEQENNDAFAEGVIVIPKGTVITLKSNGVLEIKNCPVTLAQGDIFVVYDGGMPIAFAATSVTVEDNITTVSVTTDGTEKAMTDFYFSGTVEADLEQFVAADATSYMLEDKLVTEGPTLYGISYDNAKKVLNASKTISLRDGLSATVKCDIKNVALNIYCDKAKDQCRVVFNGNTKLTASIYGNAMKALTGTTKITLGYVPVLYGVGYIELAAECSLTGEIALVWEGQVGIGFAYDKGDFRVIKEFIKKNFSFSAELSAQVGLRQDIGIDLWLLKASIWASTGAQMDLSDVSYTEGTPKRCKDFEGYLYLRVGAQAKIFGVKTYKVEEDVLKKHNSPVRVHYHYEDGSRVTACSRSEDISGYHTDMSSQYYNSSYGNVSSTYTNSSGQSVKLWSYTLDENNLATITGYGGSAYTLNIPASIDGHPVVAIGSDAFKGKTGIGVVSIPRGITGIGSYAFYNCSGLANILIPDSVTSIGSSAFENCTSLTEVTIPGSGVSIDQYAFTNCTGLERVSIPDSAVFTGYAKGCGVFNGCNIKLIITCDTGLIAASFLDSDYSNYSDAKKGITEIVICEGITAIGSSAFYCGSGYYSNDRKSVKKITLPSTVTSIGMSAFEYCAGLTEIIMPQGSKDIVVELGSSAFYGCSSLKAITVPEGVTQIKGSTFYGCSALETVVFPTTVVSIGDNAFRYCNRLPQIELPAGLVSIGSSAFSNCTGLTNIVIPNDVTSIGSYAFSDCTSLTEVTIPGSGVSIGEHAFTNCTGLERVSIPDSAVFTSNAKTSGVFGGCNIKLIITCDTGLIADSFLNSSSSSSWSDAKEGITEIVICEGITAIGSRAFYCASGYHSNDRKSVKKITLPSTVTSIGTSAFEYCAGLTEIIMPQGSKDIVVELGDSAFYGCSSLKAITVPEGVTQIKGSTFYGCSALETVAFPTTIVSIGGSAFYNCGSLTEIELPVGVTTIGSSAFYNCTGLGNILIPDSVISIGSYAFYGCTSLTEVTIPGSGVSIDYHAFWNCTGLETVKIPDSAVFTDFAKQDGVFGGCDIKLIITCDTGIIAESFLGKGNNSSFTEGKLGITEIEICEGITEIGNYAFYCYYSGYDNESVKKIILPATVTAIGGSAFYNCTGLTEIVMPQGSKDIVVELGGSAFYGCSSLKAIAVPEGVTQIKGSTFYGCSALETVVFPTTIVSIGGSAFYNCGSLTEIELPVGVTTIGSSAFYNCTGLGNILIPDDVTGVGAHAFEHCTSLSGIEFGRSLTKINSSTFYGCTGLTSVAVPVWITSIGDNAFYGCTALENISVYDSTTYGGNVFSGDSITLTIRCQNGTIPKDYLKDKLAGVKRIVIDDEIISIGSYAFYGGSMLESVVLPAKITGISDYTFYGCSSLREINIHDRIMRIGNYAFSGCASLEQVTIPDSVSEFGTYVFKNCTALGKVKMPVVMRSLPSGTFYGCTSLEEVSLSRMIETFDSHAFYNCESLAAVPWTEKIRTVGESAFRGCDALTEIEVPNAVASIGSYAFAECSALRTVVLPEGLEIISSYLFYDCDALENYVVPDGIKTIGEGAFKDCDSLITATIPSSVTSVGTSCFYDCDALKTLDIAEGVLSIGASCFYDCDAIEELWLPKTVTTLGKNCWYSCDSLRIIKLSEELTAVPEGAFMDCAVLPEVYVPRNVTSIGPNAFNVCPALVKVTIPQTTTTIAANALSYPDRLVVYGLEGSYAQTFAETNGYAFVVNEVNAQTVTLNYTELTIFKGSSVKLQLTIEPEDYTDSVSWKSGNTAVATVTDKGEVTGISVGTAVVKVVVGDSSAKCKITVVQPVTKITLNKTSYTMAALDTLQMTATVAPTTATNAAVIWSSSDPTVALVDENGLVTAYGKGTTTITASAADGSGITASCVLSVTNSAYFPKNTEQFESTHKYTSNCNDYWIYTAAGAKSLTLTFDERTEMEDGFDYLYIYDGQNNEIGCFTGEELAGQTVVIPGEMVMLRLLTDESGTEWGFKVSGIVADGHNHVFANYIDNQDATCTADGSKTAKCELCGVTDTVTVEGTALGHDFGNGICKVCGVLEPGDLDGSGEIDVDDVLALLLHVSMPNVFPIDGEADFDNNGMVDVDDVTILLLYVSMPDMFPL